MIEVFKWLHCSSSRPTHTHSSAVEKCITSELADANTSEVYIGIIMTWFRTGMKAIKQEIRSLHQNPPQTSFRQSFNPLKTSVSTFPQHVYQRPSVGPKDPPLELRLEKLGHALAFYYPSVILKRTGQRLLLGRFTVAIR